MMFSFTCMLLDISSVLNPFFNYIALLGNACTFPDAIVVSNLGMMILIIQCNFVCSISHTKMVTGQKGGQSFNKLVLVEAVSCLCYTSIAAERRRSRSRERRRKRSRSPRDRKRSRSKDRKRSRRSRSRERRRDRDGGDVKIKTERVCSFCLGYYVFNNDTGCFLCML